MEQVTKELTRYNVNLETLPVVVKDLKEADVNLNMDASAIPEGVIIVREYGDLSTKKENKDAKEEIWVKANEATGKLEVHGHMAFLIYIGTPSRSLGADFRSWKEGRVRGRISLRKS